MIHSLHFSQKVHKLFVYFDMFASFVVPRNPSARAKCRQV
nr:MAG TPA: hypothetical protein [Caudoviricetes sp.]DAY64425.1 MAG TPA: hypothetical protein [Caudoviricetes sp.]